MQMVLYKQRQLQKITLLNNIIKKLHFQWCLQSTQPPKHLAVQILQHTENRKFWSGIKLIEFNIKQCKEYCTDFHFHFIVIIILIKLHNGGFYLSEAATSSPVHSTGVSQNPGDFAVEFSYLRFWNILSGVHLSPMLTSFFFTRPLEKLGYKTHAPANAYLSRAGAWKTGYFWFLKHDYSLGIKEMYEQKMPWLGSSGQHWHMSRNYLVLNTALMFFYVEMGDVNKQAVF